MHHKHIFKKLFGVTTGFTIIVRSRFMYLLIYFQSLAGHNGGWTHGDRKTTAPSGTGIFDLSGWATVSQWTPDGGVKSSSSAG